VPITALLQQHRRARPVIDLPACLRGVRFQPANRLENRGIVIGKPSASLMQAAPRFNGFPANHMSAIVAIRFVQPAPHNPLPTTGHCKLQFNRGVCRRTLRPMYDGRRNSRAVAGSTLHRRQAERLSDLDRDLQHFLTTSPAAGSHSNRIVDRGRNEFVRIRLSATRKQTADPGLWGSFYRPAMRLITTGPAYILPPPRYSWRPKSCE
jgi:hypothetical protein